MNIEIKDEDFGEKSIAMKNVRERQGARGIVLKGDKIAIFNKTLKNEYKLPGGGIDEGETPEEAFHREVLEETGCNIKIVKFLGTTTEIKSHDNFIQKSYVFVGNVLKSNNMLSLTQKELDEGAQLLWVDANSGYELIKSCMDKIKASNYENLYHTKFIVKRDTEILKYYIENELNKSF